MSRFPIRTALPAAALLLAAAAGCSSTATTSTPTPATAPSTQSAPSSPAAPGAPPAAAAQIVIDNFAFSPANLTVHPGERVTVVNHDTATHTLTANPASAFDTGPINPGKSATFTTPTTAGTYPYVCSIHASMHGTLTVR